MPRSTGRVSQGRAGVRARQSLLLESQSPGGGGGGEPVIHEDVKVAGEGGVQLANAKLWS